VSAQLSVGGFVSALQDPILRYGKLEICATKETGRRCGLQIFTVGAEPSSEEQP
jgi:hypothetical protein